MEARKNNIIYFVIILLSITVLSGYLGYKLGQKSMKGKEESIKSQETEKKEETKPQKVDISDFTFSLENALFENGTSSFTIKITNNSSEIKHIDKFVAVIKNSEGQELVRLDGVVNQDIEGNGSTIVTCAYGDDLSNYATLEYEI